MILKVLLVGGLTLLCLMLQLLFLDILGPRFVPNFVLIAVVFFNLSRGIRYSLGAAFWGGFLLDSFSGSTLGVNTFSLVMSAFLTTSVKMVIYQPGFAESRVLTLAVIALANGGLQYLVILVAGSSVSFSEAWWQVLVPETLLTVIVAHETFERLKLCASKLFAF